MHETRLRTIEQLAEFLPATLRLAFAEHKDGAAGDEQRYAHISCVLAYFGRRRSSAVAPFAACSARRAVVVSIRP